MADAQRKQQQFRMSMLDRSLLLFLSRKTGTYQSRHLGNAIEAYVSSHPSWQTEEFERWASAYFAQGVRGSRAKDQYARELQLFLTRKTLTRLGVLPSPGTLDLDSTREEFIPRPVEPTAKNSTRAVRCFPKFGSFDAVMLLYYANSFGVDVCQIARGMLRQIALKDPDINIQVLNDWLNHVPELRQDKRLQDEASLDIHNFSLILSGQHVALSTLGAPRRLKPYNPRNVLPCDLTAFELLLLDFYAARVNIERVKALCGLVSIYVQADKWIVGETHARQMAYEFVKNGGKRDKDVAQRLAKVLARPLPRAGHHVFGVDASQQRPRIVVIDHSDSYRSAIRIALGPNYLVITAPDAISGVSVIQEAQPLCVVLDMKLPLVDGLWALASVREVDPLVPVVVSPTYDAIVGSEDAPGANLPVAYLRKEDKFEEFIRKIGDAVEKGLSLLPNRGDESAQ